MQIIVTFKGKYDNKYHWERVNDSTPKQLHTAICPNFETTYPKKNQQYIIYYQRINGNELIGQLSITDYFTDCSMWRIVGEDFRFKKGKNKGFLMSEYTSCFPNNPEERKWFIKHLTGIYRKTYNPNTTNNVLRIFERWVNYCEFFGDEEGSIFLTSKRYKGVDILEIPINKHFSIRKYLVYIYDNAINPLTKRNASKWIHYLDNYFQ